MAKMNFSPSKQKRWGVCTASPALIASDVVDRSSSVPKNKDKDDGLTAHALMALCIPLSMSPYDFINESIDVRDVGSVRIDGEMADYVNDAIQYIFDHIKPGWTVETELRIDLNHIIPGQKGDGDVVAYDPDKPFEVHCFDLKYGRGVKEFAERNGEVMLHAIGVIDSHIPQNKRRFVDSVTIHIVQPRMQHYDFWQTNKKELHAFGVKCTADYEEALDPEKRKFVPSVDGCRFCEKRSSCRALRESIYAKAVLGKDAFGGIELKDPDLLTDEELAEMWEWLGFISAWANNVSEHMLDRARKGTQFGGLKLIKGPDGKREWIDEEKAEQWLRKKKLEDFEMYNSTLITAPQAQKLLGAKNVIDAFKELVTQRPGSSKLVKESDRGTDLNKSLADEFE